MSAALNELFCRVLLSNHILLLAKSVLATDNLAKEYGVPGVCSLDEIDFLRGTIDLAEAGCELERSDLERLEVLFARAGASPHVTLAEPHRLKDGLRHLEAFARTGGKAR
jgi:hypothetical protein